MTETHLPVNLFKSILTGHCEIPLLLDSFRPSLRDNASTALVNRLSAKALTPHMDQRFRRAMVGLAVEIGERDATPLGAAYEAAFIAHTLTCRHVSSDWKDVLTIRA